MSGSDYPWYLQQAQQKWVQMVEGAPNQGPSQSQGHYDQQRQGAPNQGPSQSQGHYDQQRQDGREAYERQQWGHNSGAVPQQPRASQSFGQYQQQGPTSNLQPHGIDMDRLMSLVSQLKHSESDVQSQRGQNYNSGNVQYPDRSSSVVDAGVGNVPRNASSMGYSCEICNLNFPAWEDVHKHFGAIPHFENYLTKQLLMGFDAFSNAYSFVPCLDSSDDTHGLEFERRIPDKVFQISAEIEKAHYPGYGGKLVEYWKRCGRLYKGVCKLCDVKTAGPDWWHHITGKKHSTKMLSELDHLGVGAYLKKYGAVPVCNENIFQRIRTDGSNLLRSQEQPQPTSTQGSAQEGHRQVLYTPENPTDESPNYLSANITPSRGQQRESERLSYDQDSRHVVYSSEKPAGHSQQEKDDFENKVSAVVSLLKKKKVPTATLR